MNYLKVQYRQVIEEEKRIYMDYMFPSYIRYILSWIKYEPARMIWRWQREARLKDFYDEMRTISRNPWYKLMYFLYICKCNRHAQSLGLDIGTKHIGKGLLIYHGNNVINAYSIIGENLHLHGGNVIGNKGPEDPQGSPVIGNNVTLGAGAKIIGRVHIADNIKIAAGAVVVHSFEETGIIIAGIPAKKIK